VATPTDSAAFITAAWPRPRSTSPPGGWAELSPPVTRNQRRVGSSARTGSTDAPVITAPSQSTSTSAVPASALRPSTTTAPRPPSSSAPSSPAAHVDCSGVGASA
jgi:hypothetical protein